MRLSVLASVVALFLVGCSPSAQLPVAPTIVVSNADSAAMVRGR